VILLYGWLCDRQLKANGSGQNTTMNRDGARLGAGQGKGVKLGTLDKLLTTIETLDG
jgi:hypothetical protein